MQRLITDLLTLSSLESAASASSEEAITLEPMLQSVLAEAQALSAGRHELIWP